MRRLFLLLVSFFFLVLVTANVAVAEDPVYFPDSNLKSAIEEELGVSDPAPTDMLNLITLNAQNRGIADVNGLEYGTNLETLNLRYNVVTEITALSGLTNLATLILHSNQISDISALSGLTNLTYLYLGQNQIIDISALSGLTNLTWLNVNDNHNVSDIGSLSNLTNLTFLALYNNQISDISALSGLTNLTTLSLGLNQIVDISALAGLTNLTGLNLTRNQIIDISALAGLTNLTGPDLSDNQITDISPLVNLVNIVTLNLGGNQVANINTLSSLTNMGILFLDNNNVSDISALQDVTGLAVLNLFLNPLNCSAYLSVIPLIEENNPGINLHYDPMPPECLESCSSGGPTNASGNSKGIYLTDETVYASGGCSPASSDVDVYIVPDDTWTDGMTIPSDLSDDGMNTIQTDGSGSLGPIAVWQPPLTVGEYDMVFDANQNGVYDAGIDVVDDPNHPGFTVTTSGGGAVGGTAFMASKIELLTPWIALGTLILLSIGIVASRRFRKKFKE